MRMADQRRMRRRSGAFVEQSFQPAGRAVEEERLDSGGHTHFLHWCNRKPKSQRGGAETRRKFLFSDLERKIDSRFWSPDIDFSTPASELSLLNFDILRKQTSAPPRLCVEKLGPPGRTIYPVNESWILSSSPVSLST